jgi:catechol 2,3-dioxygenase-like lactoylglutathione lyase family enzyme
MKITGADHTNRRVRDLQRSLRFYRDVLELESLGLEEFHRKERPIVSLRVASTFILHLGLDPSSEPGPTGGYDHLALMVEETDAEALAEYVRRSGVEIERRLEGVVRVQGEGEALYVRDPDGYLIELKLYGPLSSQGED